VKTTKRGQGVAKVRRERYLRDDVYVGCGDAAVEARYRGRDETQYVLRPERRGDDGARTIALIDSNVALHQMDALADARVTDVVVCATVMEETRNKSKTSYERLRGLCKDAEKRFYVFSNENHAETYAEDVVGESANDRNDRAIRKAAAFYRRAIPRAACERVTLVTNDRGNARKAREENIDVMSVMEWIQSISNDASLVDLVVPGGGAEIPLDERDAKRAKSGAAASAGVFEAYLDANDIKEGLANGTLIKGGVRTSRYNPFEAHVTNEGTGEGVLLSGRAAMNRAIDGDLVAVEILPESQWIRPGGKIITGTAEEDKDAASADVDAKDGDGGLAPETADEMDVAVAATKAHGAVPTGKVVGIIRRNWRERGYAASIDMGRDGKGPAAASGGFASRVLCVPSDRRFPKIRIQTRQLEGLLDQRIVVVIDDWPADSMYPEGHYVKSLGLIGSVDAETQALLLENDVDDRPFAPAVYACVPALPWKVTDDHLAEPGREDLRDLLVCSVDPPGCKDIDDALSAREIDDERIEIGVHIADVTSFLFPDTAMDEEAARRGTTTYLVQRRLDMLPGALTTDICSLVGGQERLAFSVFWIVKKSTMLPDETIKPRFTKSVIKSAAALTYEQAQTRIDDASLNDDLTVSLRRLRDVARQLRKRRMTNGALTLASPEVRFEMDQQSSDPLDVGMYPAAAMLRRHPIPEQKMFEPLLKAAKACGVDIDAQSNRTLATSLDAAVRPDDAYFNTLLRLQATRCMSQAVYCSSGQYAGPERMHYGLAMPLYTHFTSPIRRYADVIVHRLLSAAIGLCPRHKSLEDSDHVKSVADVCNLRHRNSQQAGRASVELHTLVFFRKRKIIADARVFKVRANGLVVFVPKFGIEGPVLFVADEHNEAATCVLDEEAMTVTHKGKTWKVFDQLTVRVEVEQLPAHRSRLLITIVPDDTPRGEIASA
jgi:exosome complex exonuclease DIS3/RRP44